MPFRVHRQAVGLTYSCPVNAEDNPIVSHQEILDFAESIGTCLYKIAREYQQDGKVHWHAYLKFDHILDTTNCRFFDLLGVHPNLIKGTPGPGWIKYLDKYGDVISNLATDPYTEALACSTPEQGLDILWAKKPSDMMRFGASIEANLRKRMRVAIAPRIWYGPYAKLFYMNYDPCVHSLLIVGPPGIGKTQFARYLLGDYDYVKDSIEGLRNCTFTKPILFDDVDVSDMSDSVSKALTDVLDGGAVKMRYNDVIIPPGIPRIFCHNNYHCFSDPYGAVYDRRLKVLEIPGLQ